MTDNTINAADLEKVLEDWKFSEANQRNAREFFQDVQRLLQERTMEDIKWNDHVHFGAEARTHLGGEVVMLAKSKHTNVIFVRDSAGNVLNYIPKDLTPTGKRYRLVESGGNVFDDAGGELPYSPTGKYRDHDGDIWISVAGFWGWGGDEESARRMARNPDLREKAPYASPAFFPVEEA